MWDLFGSENPTSNEYCHTHANDEWLVGFWNNKCTWIICRMTPTMITLSKTYDLFLRGKLIFVNE